MPTANIITWSSKCRQADSLGADGFNDRGALVPVLYNLNSFQTVSDRHATQGLYHTPERSVIHPQGGLLAPGEEFLGQYSAVFDPDRQ
jgi:hypothetical protein